MTEQELLQDYPFDGKECDPSYVIEWVDETFTVAPKDWTPLCFIPSDDGERCINPRAYGMSIEDSCMDCPYRKRD